MKKTTIIILLILNFSLFSSLGNTATLTWEKSSGNIKGYNIYYGKAPYSLHNTINVGNTLSINILKTLPLVEGDYFIGTNSYNDYYESDLSNQIIISLENGKFVSKPLQITLNNQIVEIEWDEINGVSGYKVYCDDIEKDDVNIGYSSFLVKEGKHTISVKPYDSTNRLFNKSNKEKRYRLYEPTIIDINNFSNKPEKPELLIDIICRNENDNFIFGGIKKQTAISDYEIYVCSTYENAKNLVPDIDYLYITENNFWLDVENNYKIIFLAILAISENGTKSKPAIAWAMPGNIVGTYNQGTEFTMASVDFDDLAELFSRSNWLHTTNNQPIEYYQDYQDDLYDILPIQQKSDLNGDGKTDYKDVFIFSIYF